MSLPAFLSSSDIQSFKDAIDAEGIFQKDERKEIKDEIDRLMSSRNDLVITLSNLSSSQAPSEQEKLHAQTVLVGSIASCSSFLSTQYLIAARQRGAKGRTSSNSLATRITNIGLTFVNQIQAFIAQLKSIIGIHEWKVTFKVITGFPTNTLEAGIEVTFH